MESARGLRCVRHVVRPDGGRAGESRQVDDLRIEIGSRTLLQFVLQGPADAQERLHAGQDVRRGGRQQHRHLHQAGGLQHRDGDQLELGRAQERELLHRRLQRPEILHRRSRDARQLPGHRPLVPCVVLLRQADHLRRSSLVPQRYPVLPERRDVQGPRQPRRDHPQPDRRPRFRLRAHPGHLVDRQRDAHALGRRRAQVARLPLRSGLPPLPQPHGA